MGKIKILYPARFWSY